MFVLMEKKLATLYQKMLRGRYEYIEREGAAPQKFRSIANGVDKRYIISMIPADVIFYNCLDRILLVFFILSGYMGMFPSFR